MEKKYIIVPELRFESKICQEKITGFTPFFSVGTRVAPPLGLGIEYEAKRINAFINITPFRSFPFALSLLAINLNKAGGLNKMISVSGSFFYDFISR